MSKSRQLTLVFELDASANPEITMMTLAEFAKQATTCEVTIELDDADYYFNEDVMTHIIVRDLEDGVEKDQIAWKVLPEEDEEIVIAEPQLGGKNAKPI